MNRIKISLAFLLIFIGAGAWAQLQVYPSPQQVQTTNQVQVFAQRAFALMGDTAWIDADNRQFLNTILPVRQLGIPVEVQRIKSGDKNILQSGAYRLAVSDSGIVLEAYDNTGLYYAMQTLSQITKKGQDGVSVTRCKIVDFPSIKLRGTVEGFYGSPWSFKDRVSQLNFYGKIKLNTYIYGPKDDPYHSSPHWRDPYPAAKAKEIAALVKIANQNKVHFVWAIHPGKDIQWNKADSLAVLKKFEWMYQLGVRAFAVFFDDISGIGTSAEKQADLLNFLQENFVEKKQDVMPLLMCPTEYNKAWANKKPGTYLDILGERLNPAIHIMWTGNTVVSDITSEGLRWVDNRIKRPAMVWWNFPVSDYVRNHLLMGAAYGLDTSAKALMWGFVSNPMEHAEASKVAIFGVAQYAWNMQDYHPQKSWQQACRFLMPQAAKAFELFCANNADPGKNGHGYRRIESAKIAPAANFYLKDLAQKNYHSDSSLVLRNYFKAIVEAPKQIRDNAKNKALVKEIDPWLSQFHLLGLAGIQALQLVNSFDKEVQKDCWDDYLKLGALFTKMDSVDKNNNQNPYQKGVKTGSLVLKPFVKKIYKQLGSALMQPYQTAKQGADNEGYNTLLTNIDLLRHQPISVENDKVKIAPKLEVISLQPGEYIGLALDNGRRAKSLAYDFSTKKMEGKLVFQSSSDAKKWRLITSEKLKTKGKIGIGQAEAKYIRVLNVSDSVLQMRLLQFEVLTENKGLAASNLCYDLNVNTFQRVTQHTGFKIRFERKKLKKGLLVLMNSFAQDVKIIGSTRSDKVLFEYKGNDNYVWIPAANLRHVKSLTLFADGAINLYEVIAR